MFGYFILGELGPYTTAFLIFFERMNVIILILACGIIS